MEMEITIDQACTFTNLEPKRLIGLALRNEFTDPLIVNIDRSGRPIFLKDWRLEKYVVIKSQNT